MDLSYPTVIIASMSDTTEVPVLIPVNAWKGKTVYAMVDAADADWARQYKWGLGKDGYAYRQVSLHDTGGKRGIKATMHRELAGTPKGKVTDHINQNRLDNRRSNLRVLDRQAHNLQNQPKRRETKRVATSAHRGVSLYKQGGFVYWRARVTVDGKEKTEYFHTEPEAIEAVARMRKELMPFSVAA